jgi:CRP-like cAMP-binding protein
MRHQFATVHELARVEMLAGLPGEVLGPLAERMERTTLEPGEEIPASEHERDRFYVVLAGMLSSAGGVLRPGDTVGGLEPVSHQARAVTPAVVASCDRATFDELVRPGIAQD